MVTRNARRSDTLVYLGTVDDVVLRYPWPGIAIDENFLVETIVDHVLFGAPLLINDGYIVNHPLARADLMKGKDSLILALVRKGFIKILTRVDDLNDLARMPEQMAVDIDSFRSRISDPDWKLFRYNLDDLGEALRPAFNTMFWPPVDMGDGFRLLVENASAGIDQKGYESLGLRTGEADLVRTLLDLVANRLATDTSGARNFFEAKATDLAGRLPNGTDRLFVDDVMGLANEIYHFNFGLNLDHQMRGDGISVVTETRFSRAFDDLLAVDEAIVNVEGSMPLMGKPALNATLDPKSLLDIVDPTTDVGQAKLNFQKRMRDFATGRHSIDEARAFAELYERALIGHFADRRAGRVLPHIVNLGMNLSSAVIGAYVAPVHAAMQAAGEIGGGFGMGLLSSYVGERGLLRVGHRFRQRAVRKEFGANRGALKPHIQRAMLSTLRFEPAIIDPIADRVRKY